MKKLIENLNDYPLLLDEKIVKVFEEDDRIIFMTHSAGKLYFCDCDFVAAKEFLSGSYQDLLTNLKTAPNVIRAVIDESSQLYESAAVEYINAPVTWLLSEDFSESKKITEYIEKSNDISIAQHTEELLNNEAVRAAAKNAVKMLIRDFEASQSELTDLFETKAAPILARALREGSKNLCES